MFFDFVEEVIPSPDQTALVLVVHQIEFIRIPHLSNLRTKKKNYYLKSFGNQGFILHHFDWML